MTIIPTFQEEIHSKAFETIEWLINSLHQAKITEEQFSTGVNALFMALSGLIPSDLFEIITACQTEIKRENPTLTRTFLSERGKTLTISWTAGESEVLVALRFVKGGEIVDGQSSRSFDTPKDAFHWFINSAESLAKKANCLELKPLTA